MKWLKIIGVLFAISALGHLFHLLGIMELEGYKQGGFILSAAASFICFFIVHRKSKQNVSFNEKYIDDKDDDINPYNIDFIDKNDDEY